MSKNSIKFNFYVYNPYWLFLFTYIKPSIFGGSIWEWNEQRQQYYLHVFYIEQPDLNYRSPYVQE